MEKGANLDDDGGTPDLQLLTGTALVYIVGYDWTVSWILWGLVLYFCAGACWLPVVWVQIKMRDMAKLALAQGTTLPDQY